MNAKGELKLVFPTEEYREQIEEYAIFEEIEKLSKYTIVVINDKLHVKNMINVYKVKWNYKNLYEWEGESKW